MGGTGPLGSPCPPARSSDPPRAASLLQTQPGLEPSIQEQEPASSLLDLHLTADRDVATVEGGVVLASALTGQARVTGTRRGMLILGMETADGAATAIEDFPLAKVAAGRGSGVF